MLQYANLLGKKVEFQPGIEIQIWIRCRFLFCVENSHGIRIHPWPQF